MAGPSMPASQLTTFKWFGFFVMWPFFVMPRLSECVLVVGVFPVEFIPVFLLMMVNIILFVVHVLLFFVLSRGAFCT